MAPSVGEEEGRAVRRKADRIKLKKHFKCHLKVQRRNVRAGFVEED